MLIVCPNCATSYTITGPSLGAAGRTVRCARCQTQWFATPTRDEPARSVVDDLIAEANARPKPGLRPAPAPAMPVATPPPAISAASFIPPAPAPEPVAQATPAPAIAPLPADDIAQFTAALDQVSPIEPMTRDDVSTPIEHAAPAIEIGEAPPIVPPETPAGLDAGTEDIEHFAARRAARQNAQRKRSRATQIPAIVILLGLIAGAIVIWRNDLVRHVPQTASLFSAIGLPVNVRNLTFEDVTVSKETHDGVAVLIVEGKIVATGGKPADVPRLRFAIRNSSGNEIYSWTAQPPRSILGAGESVPFRSRLASPPADANDVLVRFFTARDLATGSK